MLSAAQLAHHRLTLQLHCRAVTAPARLLVGPALLTAALQFLKVALA